MLHNSERLQFAACWAHARRTVYEVSKENRYREKLLDMIQGLYDVNAREQGMDTQARTEHRQKYALPLLEVIKKYVDSLTEAEVLPKSDMAGALGYIRNHWDALTVYASNGQIPIDNNRVEQLMRQVALGRKNWLFVANVESGERVARLMSIVSSATQPRRLEVSEGRAGSGIGWRDRLFEAPTGRLETGESRSRSSLPRRRKPVQIRPQATNACSENHRGQTQTTANLGPNCLALSPPCRGRLPLIDTNQRRKTSFFLYPFSRS